MTEIWTEERKFSLWLAIELATLDARAKMGLLAPEIAEKIRKQAKVDIKRIDEIEAEIDHDLLAFVQAVQEKLDDDIRGEFHQGLTSFDTEEIPTALRIRESLDIIGKSLDDLNVVLLLKAREHRDTLMVAKTHGQHAEPYTFGLRLLGWCDIFRRDAGRLLQARERISVGKLSGAVGTYSELSPKIEELVCQSFDLHPPKHATQILHRDRIAQVITTLAILASDIEHVAVNFRKMADSDTLEVREPFRKKQKGSSAMPHKKNTIVTERLCGMARVVRANCLVALGNITTWEERDISQSAPERIILPDTFQLVHYMLKKLTWVLEKMEVFPQNMLKNMGKTHGCIYSGHVKNLLLKWGIDPETVYRLVQEKSFRAMQEGEQLLSLLIEDQLVKKHISDPEKLAELEACFDPWGGLKNINEIFTRFGL